MAVSLDQPVADFNAAATSGPPRIIAAAATPRASASATITAARM